MLHVEVIAAALVRWYSGDGGAAIEAETTDAGLGVRYVDLPTGALSPGVEVRFTFH